MLTTFRADVPGARRLQVTPDRSWQRADPVFVDCQPYDLQTPNDLQTQEM